jgi:predicted nucleotidyltransferase component of viral defense system
MLKNREKINTVIDRFMDSQGYKKSPKSKTPYSLDSWVYKYTNAGGNLDNIKIEINYSLRSHILCAEERSIVTEYFSSDYKIKSLDPIEIYASKINALLNRAAARDLYDIRNMIKFGLFDEKEKIILKKGVIFYAAISSKKINKKLDANVIDSITKHKIRTDLLPVIGSNDDFNLNVSNSATT